MKQSLSMPIRIVLVLAVALIVWIVGVMVGQENTVTILNPDTSIRVCILILKVLSIL